jgi:serine/threonine-protein kinase
MLGEGGMGYVYAAQHELLGQRVAIKVLRPELTAADESAAARFMQEARAAARLESDHVARVSDVGRLPSGLPFLVMEYLEGRDLGVVLEESGPLPVMGAVDYVLQALEGLAQAHHAGLVHRDLKPANLFLARRADGLVRVKVLDFGIAKATRTARWRRRWSPPRTPSWDRPRTCPRSSSSNRRTSTRAAISGRSASCSTSS